MELVAELRGRGGQTRAVRVLCPVEESERGQLRALRRALGELQERVVEMLAPLVQQERAAAAGGGGGRRAGAGEDEEEDEEDEDEDEAENDIETEASAEDPPPKRTKVQQPR
ncbi:uncharacterized protein AAHN32_001610 [Aegotheles albertisi]